MCWQVTHNQCSWVDYKSIDEPRLARHVMAIFSIMNPINDMYEGKAGGLKWEPYVMWITLLKVRCLQYILLQKILKVCTSMLHT